MTNYEKIRNMSVKDMALFLQKVFCNDISIALDMKDTEKCIGCKEKYCNTLTEEWLKSER